MPYAELLRRFAAAVVRPQSVLFVVGYGFGDDHIRAIVRQALAIPSFTLVIVDPNPQSDFVAQLRKQSDRRVWIFSGSTFGVFTGFVRHALADLRDESIRRKVMDTYRALGQGKPAERDGGETDA
jgi:phospholipid N-methyltransferase